MLEKLAAALSAIACVAVFLAAPASAQTPGDELARSYEAELAPLNAPGGGSASVTVSGGTATVTVQADDLAPATAWHAQHLHGTPGEPGACPDPDTADADADGIVTTAEGASAYGPLRVSLTTSGDVSPDSAVAADRYPITEQGAYTYERAIDLDAATADGLGDLQLVIHGDDLNASGEYDGDARSSITDDLPLEATVPTACGSLRLSSIELPEPYSGAAGAEGAVVRTYLAMLDRTPDPGGFEYWADRLAAGTDVTRLAGLVAGSSEFERRFGDAIDDSSEEWVDFVYSAVLGRTPDPSGEQYWAQRLEDGTLSRPQMVVAFAHSSEYRRLTGTS